MKRVAQSVTRPGSWPVWLKVGILVALALLVFGSPVGDLTLRDASVLIVFGGVGLGAFWLAFCGFSSRGIPLTPDRRITGGRGYVVAGLCLAIGILMLGAMVGIAVDLLGGAHFE